MVGALVGRAVTEEADHHVVLAAHFEGQGRAGGDGQVAAHDSIGGHSAHGDVAGVHSAADAVAAAVRRAEHLAHHGLDGDALGDVVTGGTVGGGHPVLLAQIVQHTYRAGLLTSGLVDRAGHDALQEQVIDALLVLADLCLLYTSPSPRDGATSRMPSSA